LSAVVFAVALAIRLLYLWEIRVTPLVRLLLIDGPRGGAIDCHDAR